MVSNGTGTVTSSDAALTVTAAPVAPTITTQPAAQTVDARNSVTFSVVATGTPSPIYQWKKNGTDISGANSASYNIPATPSTDNGAVFSVVVSNSAGSVTSSDATLTVNRYSRVANASGGTYTKEECVKDNSTGLIWEGKPTTGTARLASTKYTNYDDATKFQKGTIAPFVKPDPTSDIAASGNSIGYKTSVNSVGLCGYSTWRLPTKDELLGIRDSSPTAPKIDHDWFPNTQLGNYWSSAPGDNDWEASAVYFGTDIYLPGSNGASSLVTELSNKRNISNSVRLVHD